MEAVSHGRKVFIQMVDDILCRKEENERVREAEVRAAQVRAAYAAGLVGNE